MTGKEKCRILKEIRQQIARENDIELITTECTHKGECRGTCPKCESEVRYLEQQLEQRRRMKKNIALAGISAGIAASLAGCTVVETIKDVLDPGRDLVGMVEKPYVTEIPDDIELMGDIVAPDFMGEIDINGPWGDDDFEPRDDDDVGLGDDWL